jgi:hypothetical protein
MTREASAATVTASDPVRHWRLEALVKAGYPRTDALVLSQRADIDLHSAITLLEQGCPAETAMRILL